MNQNVAENKFKTIGWAKHGETKHCWICFVFLTFPWQRMSLDNECMRSHMMILVLVIMLYLCSPSSAPPSHTNHRRLEQRLQVGVEHGEERVAAQNAAEHELIARRAHLIAPTHGHRQLVESDAHDDEERKQEKKWQFSFCLALEGNERIWAVDPKKMDIGQWANMINKTSNNQEKTVRFPRTSRPCAAHWHSLPTATASWRWGRTSSWIANRPTWTGRASQRCQGKQKVRCERGLNQSEAQMNPVMKGNWTKKSGANLRPSTSGLMT